MHELSITQNILAIALDHCPDEHHITDIHIVVGQLASIIDDCVAFYWDIISAGTVAQGAQLHFERVPALLRCRTCDTNYALNGLSLACPNCDSADIEICAGEEFYVSSIEVNPIQTLTEEMKL